MNLTKLFEMQKVLDEKIVKEKGLEGQDLLDKKILALQVELGELANEWRGFKFWSEDQQSTPKLVCNRCQGHGKIVLNILTKTSKPCSNCYGNGYNDPLLEEYVDCLHFILSIGLEINKTDPVNSIMIYQLYEDASTDADFVVGTFSQIFKNTWNVHSDYTFLVVEFLKLGVSLDFTWEQIEQAYFDKNKVNHERQNNGY